MESPYDLVLGMLWLAKYQPWIDWCTRTVASSTQDAGKDVLLREAYATDVVTNTVESALTRCQTLHIGTQSQKPGSNEGALTGSQVANFHPVRRN